MATIRLVPSTYYLSSSTYLSVSNANNMYNNTDNTTYATVYNSRTSTTSYYIYVRGFNFDDIPNAAVVSNFTVKLKTYQSGVSTSSSYQPYLANGTTAINGSCSAITTTASVHQFTGVTADWDTIKGYGDNFGIRINCRRASRNTAAYMYIYGAEIEVTYTVPDPRTVTTTLSGNGTISPLGNTTTYDGEEFELIITPTDKSDTVTATQDGVDITSQLVAHGAGNTSTFTASDHTTSGIQSGSSYASYCIGHTAESPSSSGTSSNMYASSSSTGYAAYSFDFSNIPSNATIEDIEVRCYGHRESNTISSTYVSQCILYQGSTAISDEVDFPSTSNSIITVIPTSMPTRSELDNITLRHYVGYYGGLVLGISFDVTYSTGTGIDHYTYTYTVSGNSTIAVVIGGSGSQPKIYIKEEGSATLLYTYTNTDSDESIQAYNSYNETLSVNDNIKVVLSDIVAYRSGGARISNFNDTIITTLTSNQTEYVGENEVKVRIYYNSSYYSISPYYLWNGYNCTFTGTMSVYKLNSSSGWVQYSKVYKKINGSWVEQASSTWATLFNTNTNYRKME